MKLLFVTLLLTGLFLPKKNVKFSEIYTEKKKIVGEILGLEVGEIVLLESSKHIIIDSVKSEKNKFTISIPNEEIEMYNVTIERENLYFQIISDSNVVIKGDLNNRGNVQFIGSPETSKWNNYLKRFVNPKRETLINMTQQIAFMRKNQDTSEIYKKKIAQRDSIFFTSYSDAYRYINNNPNSFISLYLLNWGFEKIKDKVSIDNVVKNFYNHSLTKEILDKLKKESLNIGDTIPKFSLFTLDDNIFDQSSLDNKYTIIDFWGTWCAPCLEMAPELVRLYNIPRSKKLNFVGVVCEKVEVNRNRIQRLCAEKKMTWAQAIVDIKSADSTEQMWGINSFPTFILVGPDRSILARGEGSRGLNNCINYLSKVK